MTETGTVSVLLAAQTERKLNKMREGIVAEIARLQPELGLVEGALNTKRRSRSEGKQEMLIPATTRDRTGQFDGLSRDSLLQHVRDMGKPVEAPEVRAYLAGQGIDRRLEAVRVGFNRLARDAKLLRLQDGSYVVPSTNGHAIRPGAEAPPPAGTLDRELGDGLAVVPKHVGSSGLPWRLGAV